MLLGVTCVHAYGRPSLELKPACTWVGTTMQHLRKHAGVEALPGAHLRQSGLGLRGALGNGAAEAIHNHRTDAQWSVATVATDLHYLQPLIGPCSQLQA